LLIVSTDQAPFDRRRAWHRRPRPTGLACAHPGAGRRRPTPGGGLPRRAPPLDTLALLAGPGGGRSPACCPGRFSPKSDLGDIAPEELSAACPASRRCSGLHEVGELAASGRWGPRPWWTVRRPPTALRMLTPARGRFGLYLERAWAAASAACPPAPTMPRRRAVIGLVGTRQRRDRAAGPRCSPMVNGVSAHLVMTGRAGGSRQRRSATNGRPWR